MSTIPASTRVSLCLFTFADGRRCRTPRTGAHPHFCFYHAQKEVQSAAAESLAKQLSYFFSGQYLSACDLSSALGRLIPAVLRSQIKPKTARTVAYLMQTLMQTIHISQDEYINAFSTDGWRRAVRNSVNSNYDYDHDHLRPDPAPSPTPASAPISSLTPSSSPTPSSSQFSTPSPGPDSSPSPAPSLAPSSLPTPPPAPTPSPAPSAPVSARSVCSSSSIGHLERSEDSCLDLAVPGALDIRRPSCSARLRRRSRASASKRFIINTYRKVCNH